MPYVYVLSMAAFVWDATDMIPIQDVFNRIRWDKHYGDAQFEIGYYDRIQNQILRVPLRQLQLKTAEPFTFLLVDDEGESHTIPYHRVKEIYRNGELIWHREH